MLQRHLRGSSGMMLCVVVDLVAGELCDVVLAALVALATITGGTPQAESRLNRHVAARAVRLRSLRAAA
jgi:hypothetical protein